MDTLPHKRAFLSHTRTRVKYHAQSSILTDAADLLYPLIGCVTCARMSKSLSHFDLIEQITFRLEQSHWATPLPINSLSVSCRLSAAELLVK